MLRTAKVLALVRKEAIFAGIMGTSFEAGIVLPSSSCTWIQFSPWFYSKHAHYCIRFLPCPVRIHLWIEFKTCL